MLARVQGVEVRGAVDAEHHGLAVDGELLLAVVQRSLDDPGVSLGQSCPLRVKSRTVLPWRSTRRR
jgi:hypothetical protein